MKINQTNMSLVSVVIITHNCENLINDCLASVQWADEIIIVDLGSSDNTLKLCARYASKIEQHPWVPFADPVRDYGAKLASGNWILHIDPDERVSPKLAHWLRILAESSDERYCNAVRIPRQNIAFSRAVWHGGLWPDWQVRFGRKGKLSFSGAIHETGQVDRDKIVALDPRPELALIHLSVQDISQLTERLARYANSHAQLLFQNGRRFSVGSLIANPIYQFYRHFVELTGYRDGVVGLILAICWHFIYPILIELHLWELSQRPGLNASEKPAQSTSEMIFSVAQNRQLRDVSGYILRREIPGFNMFLKLFIALRDSIYRFFS
jgi:glycosyltransferase involved in cell wall biosynthesis